MQRICVRVRLAAALAAVLMGSDALASCGSAFCMVNTNWNLQGFAPETGLRVDVRYEYIKQDELRSGSERVGIGQFARHHDEVKTLNRNLLTEIDYTIDRDWAVGGSVPIVDRDHTHIHNHRGAQLPEHWNFTRVGDVRLTGRRQWTAADPATHALGFYGVNFGLKLPTGDIDVRNRSGDRAERSLQPGTGTTDLLFGAYLSRVLPASGASWFVQGLLQTPLNSREDYRPGRRVTLDLGYRFEATDAIGVMIQLNALYRGKDSGLQAEPEDTGGRFLYVSPGVSYALAQATQIYAFIQKPLYQHVNGVQLTADWSAVIGVSTRF
ncbi:MAG TPA: hypothetical protein VFZ14_18835 [Burkholderiales bacterium]|nr:hypothetical protein [Burkholderiales bacterium]